eukprot:gene8952-12126_t
MIGISLAVSKLVTRTCAESAVSAAACGLSSFPLPEFEVQAPKAPRLLSSAKPNTNASVTCTNSAFIGPSLTAFSAAVKHDRVSPLPAFVRTASGVPTAMSQSAMRP